MSSRPALALVAALALAGCGINSVPKAEENVNARWADVQADYQRRADLIPNLVATVKGGVAGEDKVLTDVMAARAKATQSNIQVNAADLADPNKVNQYAAAQGQLNQSLGRLLAVSEAYPQLQSQQGFSDLRHELAGTENRITNAIRDYNTSVQDYNTRIRTFPESIGAKIFYGAKPKTPYQATTPGAQNAPTVSF